MSDDPVYMKDYMRLYRERKAAAEGRVLRKYRGRPRKELPAKKMPPEICNAPGWPTKDQLMARR
jgi:hypothetical protein